MLVVLSSCSASSSSEPTGDSSGGEVSSTIESQTTSNPTTTPEPISAAANDQTFNLPDKWNDYTASCPAPENDGAWKVGVHFANSELIATGPGPIEPIQRYFKAVTNAGGIGSRRIEVTLLPTDRPIKAADVSGMTIIMASNGVPSLGDTSLLAAASEACVLVVPLSITVPYVDNPDPWIGPTLGLTATTTAALVATEASKAEVKNLVVLSHTDPEKASRVAPRLAAAGDHFGLDVQVAATESTEVLTGALPDRTTVASTLENLSPELIVVDAHCGAYASLLADLEWSGPIWFVEPGCAEFVFGAPPATLTLLDHKFLTARALQNNGPIPDLAIAAAIDDNLNPTDGPRTRTNLEAVATAWFVEQILGGIEPQTEPTAEAILAAAYNLTLQHPLSKIPIELDANADDLTAIQSVFQYQWNGSGWLQTDSLSDDGQLTCTVESPSSPTVVCTTRS